jgi:signal transduction histidine kinase/putative methionine-R-sulfoxide reductase with GAF domain
MQLPESDLVRIFEATRAITSTLRLSELLETVVRLASEVVRTERASLLLMDQATGELYFDVALGEKGEALQHVRLKKGEGIAGWVAENRWPAVVNDVTKDPRWTQKADKSTQFQTKSILAVPMQVYDKLVGVMEAINRVDGGPFVETDIQVLETFAAQAAVAIENARLFESIRQEKEKMSTILGEMVEGALLLEPSGKIVLANPAAHSLLDKKILEGVEWSDIEKAFDVKPAWAEIHVSLGGAGGIELVRKIQPPLILAGVINQVCNDRGRVTGYLVVFSNVTEERREAQLKKNFLALVSHKLKTPLVAIRGFTPMLLEKPEELTSFQKTAIETIDRNSQQLASLVEKLMWFAALEGESMELTCKPQMISSVLDMSLSDLAAFLRTTDAQIMRDSSLNDLPLVNLDKIWMKEVFRNLIENAVKFNSRAPRQVKIIGKPMDGKVEISFADNGPGIPSEERGKIFNKFYQIEGSFTGQVQGMGLGLALVKRVVEEHGGSIRVDSTLGQGSTFTVSLPLQ